MHAHNFVEIENENCVCLSIPKVLINNHILKTGSIKNYKNTSKFKKKLSISLNPWVKRKNKR